MDQVSDRPVWKEFERVRGTLGKDAIPGVILSNGQTWVEQRRFTLRYGKLYFVLWRIKVNCGKLKDFERLWNGQDRDGGADIGRGGGPMRQDREGRA